MMHDVGYVGLLNDFFSKITLFNFLNGSVWEPGSNLDPPHRENRNLTMAD